MKTNKPNKINNRLLLACMACLLAVVMLVSFIIALGKFSVDISEESSVEEQSDYESFENSEEEESSEIVNETPKKYEYYDDLVFEDLTCVNDASKNGPLAIIKSENGYPTVDQSKIVNIYSKRQNKVYKLANTSLVLYEDALVSFDKFIADFFAQVPDNDIIINKGYTVSDAITPGTTSVDLSSGYTIEFSNYLSKYKYEDPEFQYLKDQAYRYGIIQRYPEGKSSYTGHDLDNAIYRYVGLAHSMYMNHYMYSLEEYIDKIRTEGVIEYKSELESNTSYIIYYVRCDASTTDIPVPTNDNCEYSIYGDGGQGFIVTVKMTIS